ncbi:MAG: hypothetical protein Tsb0019_35120 [Roseibium sp.]
MEDAGSRLASRCGHGFVARHHVPGTFPYTITAGKLKPGLTARWTGSCRDGQPQGLAALGRTVA